MRELRAQDPASDRWLLVPEAVPLVFQIGLHVYAKTFQRAAVHLQLAMEEVCHRGAHAGQAVIFHRGALDLLGYWLRNGWDECEFFALVERTRSELLSRYAGIIHLQTAAVDAQAFYHRFPEAHRPETLEEAAEIDRLLGSVWARHPGYVFVGNAGRDWPKKATVAWGEITRLAHMSGL